MHISEAAMHQTGAGDFPRTFKPTVSTLQGFAEDSEERCKALEERTDSVLEQARGQVTTAETAIVQLQQQWDSHAQQAERQQEPLSIRVSSVEVRYEDDKSSKP